MVVTSLYSVNVARAKDMFLDEPHLAGLFVGEIGHVAHVPTLDVATSQDKKVCGKRMVVKISAWVRAEHVMEVDSEGPKVDAPASQEDFACSKVSNVLL